MGKVHLIQDIVKRGNVPMGVFVLVNMLLWGQWCNAQTLAQKELQKRLVQTRSAQELSLKGDDFYEKGDYEKATDFYAKGFSLLHEGSSTHDLRQALAQRYATAATEYARQLAKRGDYKKAKALLTAVLDRSIAPAHLGASKLLSRIDDPIFYNPALTTEHVRDVVEVGRLLREAEGFYSLGQFDRAKTIYEAVLRIDPYNQAARRGMEHIAAHQHSYAQSAYDQSRASLLADVSKAWELPNPEDNPLLSPTLDSDLGQERVLSLENKLADVFIPLVDFSEVSLNEALDFLRVAGRKSMGEMPNIILNLGEQKDGIESQKIQLKARQLPFLVALNYITQKTGTKWRIEGETIVILPQGFTKQNLVNRSLSVPPYFLSLLNEGNAPSAASSDPFSTSLGQEGVRVGRRSIIDLLKENGVSFPKGATANYIASNNQLLVRNTPDNIDLIEQVVRSTNRGVLQVRIQTKIMRVNYDHLKELGFEWSITPLAIGAAREIFAGGGVDDANNTNTAVLTTGLRSGDEVLAFDRLDTYLKADSTSDVGATALKAPGILSITAVTNNVTINLLMRGLNQKKGSDVLLAPSIVARSGERAKVEMVREFIYPTEYEPPQLPSTIGAGADITPVVPTTPMAFEKRNVGMTLEVEPTVGENKRTISLSLAPNFVEFEGFINYGSPINSINEDGTTVPITENRIVMPIFRRTSAPNATLTVYDGATVVIGGLLQENKIHFEDKVPILGDLPYVGRLFRSEGTRENRQAILITVTADIIDASGKLWRERSL